MRYTLLVVILVLVPFSASAQYYVPPGPCVLAGGTANFCLAPAQNGYWMTGSLAFQGARDFVSGPGGYFGTVELGEPRDGAGIALSASSSIYFRGNLVVGVGNFYRARVPLSENANIDTEGEGETDSAGVAVVVLSGTFRNIANTDPALRGGYRVHLTATGPEAVYWDKKSSTPEQFVVRSFSCRKAEFVYRISAVPVETQIKPAQNLNRTIEDTESFIKSVRPIVEQVREPIQHFREQ